MFLEPVILGIIQGILEWIPISSEGFLALTSKALGLAWNPVDLAVFLHAGTTLAVLVYFWKDWLDVLTLKDKELAKFLALATLVSLAVGFPIYGLVRTLALGSGLLVLMGLALIVTGKIQRVKVSLGLSLGYLALVSGLLQGLSVIPGLSRSGSTIFGLSLGRLEPARILKYSYMMSVPVIVAADVYLAWKNPGIAWDMWPAFLASFLVGLASLHTILSLSRRLDFSKFAYLFGFLCLIGGLVSFLAGA